MSKIVKMSREYVLIVLKKMGELMSHVLFQLDNSFILWTLIFLSISNIYSFWFV